MGLLMDFLAEMGKSELVSKAFRAALGTTPLTLLLTETTPAIENQNFASEHTHQENLKERTMLGHSPRQEGLARLTRE